MPAALPSFTHAIQCMHELMEELSVTPDQEFAREIGIETDPKKAELVAAINKVFQLKSKCFKQAQRFIARAKLELRSPIPPNLTLPARGSNQNQGLTASKI